MSPLGNRFEQVRRSLSARTPRRVDPLPSQAQAAVALILAPSEPGGFDILFIKRAEFPGDPWSGHLALPGGRRHGSDPDLRSTALRETFEEVGVTLPYGSDLGELDDLSPVSPHLPQIVVRPFVFRLPSHPAISPSAEVALHMWVSRDVLQAAATTEVMTILGEARSVRGYRVGPHFIWGMTERIILSFLKLL